LSNGDLLSAAERAGFDIMLTADRRIRYQQNLAGRRLALIVLSSPAWPVVKDHIPAIKAAVDAAIPGSYQEVDLPRPVLRRRARRSQLKPWWPKAELFNALLYRQLGPEPILLTFEST